MARIDLDALRDKRAVEAPVLVFKGAEFELPRELPLGVFMHLNKMQEDPSGGMVAMDFLLDALFSERKDEFLALEPSLQDVLALLENISEGYDMTVGEVQASEVTS